MVGGVEGGGGDRGVVVEDAAVEPAEVFFAGGLGGVGAGDFEVGFLVGFEEEPEFGAEAGVVSVGGFPGDQGAEAVAAVAGLGLPGAGPGAFEGAAGGGDGGGEVVVAVEGGATGQEKNGCKRGESREEDAR